MSLAGIGDRPVWLLIPKNTEVRRHIHKPDCGAFGASPGENPSCGSKGAYLIKHRSVIPLGFFPRCEDCFPSESTVEQPTELIA